jgi:hypothetical protein
LFAQVPGGTELWVTRVNGPASFNDAPAAIAVDAAGNSYVTGVVCVSLYAGCADLSWETVKYDTNGNTLWTATFDGTGNFFNFPQAIAVDGAGCAYVTGAICTAAPCDELGCYCAGSDYATIKYDSNGQQLWVARYNGGGFGPDSPAAMALDPNGNVYVTGATYGYDGVPHYATLMYDANGNAIWAARYIGPGNGLDTAAAIGADPAGNVYVTGSSTGDVASLDYATIKYDAAGNQLWVARYDGPASGDDVAVALAVSGAGNVYVTGSSSGTDTGVDYATIRYDSAGKPLWVARYDGPAHSSDWATAMALSPDESVYVTGASLGVGTSFDYATVGYDASGNQMWVARYDGPAGGADRATSIALDSFGRVTVTGSRDGGGTGATIQYSPEGTPNWLDRFDGPSHQGWSATEVVLDPDANAYVTGISFDPVTNLDWATLKLSASPPTACPSLVLSKTSYYSGAPSSYWPVTVTAPSSTCTWTVVSDVPWLLVSTIPAVQVGNGFMTVQAQTNTGATRTGHFTTGGVTYTVTQEAGALPPPPPPPPPGDVVIYASDISSMASHGAWGPASDPMSPNGVKLVTADNGFLVPNTALVAPTDYVDLTFTANANTPYAFWMRLQALANSKWNDSVWVQFSDAQVNGSQVYPMNSVSGLLVNLATDSTATSLNGWGWDNGCYWLIQPATVTFPTTGTHTLRVHVREDGVQFDQIVLSPSTYLNTPPGPRGGDSRIVPK